MRRSLLLVVLATSTLAGSTALAQRANPRQQGADRAPLRLTLADSGNEARYRVREQLARVDLPNDAVGKTTRLTGGIMVAADGRIVSDSSRIEVDLASLASDQSRRDNYVRRSTLQTAQFPTAVFVPKELRGLPSTVQALAPGEYTFQLLGDLTVHGVTKPATWQVTARKAANGEIAGTATTSFTFADYGMTIPRVAIVLSVDDLIKLEYDFRFLAR